jgi:NTP pyrophosphatase (non-canonical NTP hydrolase)
MNISKMVLEAYTNAKKKGFHDKPDALGTKIALIHSEVSEALEAHRSGRVMKDDMKAPLLKYAYGEQHAMSDNTFELVIKNTFEDELADTVIRIADLCGAMGINLEAHIMAKMRYNKGRPRLHGKRY